MRLTVLARILLHPAILAVYAAWVGALWFPPGRRLLMAAVLSAVVFGIWLFVGASVDVVKRRHSTLMNACRLLLGAALLLGAYGRYVGSLAWDLASTVLIFVGSLLLIASLRDGNAA